MDYDPNKRIRLSAADPSPLPAYNPPPPPPPASAFLSSSPLGMGGAAARRSPATARPVASVTGQGSSKLRLTVKAQPSRLRQATSGSTSSPPNPYADASESDATPVPPTRTARSTRNPRAVVEPDSDDLEDDDDDVDEAANDETMVGDDSEEDAEGDEDEDMEDMDEHPPPPIIQRSVLHGRPNVVVTAPPEGPLKSVEAKEMEDDEGEDEELSDLDSDGAGHDEDNDDEDADADGDSDDENGSRSATPDLSKLTRRQRVNVEETPDDSLMALSNEAQKKKHLTVEEHAMRRSEMAKRRKNLSEQRNEEEKMETINKLLSKPAPKRRTRAEIIAQERADGAFPYAEDGEFERPDPLYVRWINNRAGSKIRVPVEWLDSPIGEVFKSQGSPVSRAGGLIQEVS